jgi:hypothetical protein
MPPNAEIAQKDHLGMGTLYVLVDTYTRPYHITTVLVNQAIAIFRAAR